MTTFTNSDDLQEAKFVEANLHGARFVDPDLSRVVMRGVDVSAAEIDAPWLADSPFFRVNDVDVIPLVEAELNRRFPGCADRRAKDPDGLPRPGRRSRQRGRPRSCGWRRCRLAPSMFRWPASGRSPKLFDTWSLPRTCGWEKAILEIDKPFHAIGQGVGAPDDALDQSTVTTDPPTYAEVLEVRAGRVAMVRDFLASITSAELTAKHGSPHDPDFQETTLSCLHVILEEEWEHHRFAVRDLDAIEAEADR